MCSVSWRAVVLLQHLLWIALSPARAFVEMSMAPRVNSRGYHISRISSKSKSMEGRLGHLRPKFWSTVTGIETSSPTSLFAAIKFKNFEDMLLQCGNSIVVVSFNAELCGPCRLMKKELTKVSSEIGEDIKVFSVDTDKFPKLGTRYNIAVLPTLVIFKEGIIRDRIEGMKSSNYVVDRLKALS